MVHFNAILSEIFSDRNLKRVNIDLVVKYIITSSEVNDNHRNR